MLFARVGYSVSLFDIKQTQIDDALVSILDQLKGLEEVGLTNGQSAETIAARVSGALDLKECLAGAVHAQECCPETLAFKQKLFKTFDEVCDDTVVLSSSTSCICPSTFVGDMKHKSQVIVSHPVNPPHYMPLVEIVNSPDTDPAVTERTLLVFRRDGSLAEAIGSHACCREASVRALN
jgi:L-gulonate 3-dehydrogenase